MKWTAFAYSAVLALISAGQAEARRESSYKADLTSQVGAHVIYSYPGLQPPDQLYTLIRAGKVGGVILFGENVDFDTDIQGNVSRVMNSLQDTYKQSPGYTGAPLMISTDQEGGFVKRLPGGPIDSERTVGASQHPIISAIQAGHAASEALKSCGCNTNLAPVLGVYRSPDDFLDQWARSYSNDSTIVAECGTAFIMTQQLGNTIATAKHFPGLGAAGHFDDTDVQPVTISLSAKELREVDMLPYIPAIAAGVDMIMASWAVYPALDEQFPSGLSRKIIQGELRERLGFRGVTHTDALEAGALVSFGDAGARGVLAAKAGMDILLASQRNVTQGEAIFDALMSALESNELDRVEFRESTERIMRLRRKLVE